MRSLPDLQARNCSHADRDDHSHSNHHSDADSYADNNRHANSDGDADRYCDPHPDGDTDPHRNTNSHRNTNGDGNTYAHADANSNGNPDSDANAHPNSNPDAHSDADPDRDANRDTNSNSDSDCDTDRHCDGNRNTNANANADTDSDSHAYAHTDADRCADRFGAGRAQSCGQRHGDAVCGRVFAVITRAGARHNHDGLDRRLQSLGAATVVAGIRLRDCDRGRRRQGAELADRADGDAGAGDVFSNQPRGDNQRAHHSRFRIRVVAVLQFAAGRARQRNA